MTLASVLSITAILAIPMVFTSDIFPHLKDIPQLQLIIWCFSGLLSLFIYRSIRVSPKRAPEPHSSLDRKSTVKMHSKIKKKVP